MPESDLNLATFVEALRNELHRAAASSDTDMPIAVTGLTVELTVQTTSETDGKAGVQFWVITAGGSHARGSATTQKVTLELSPLDANGVPLRISDREKRR